MRSICKYEYILVNFSSAKQLRNYGDNIVSIAAPQCTV